MALCAATAGMTAMTLPRIFSLIIAFCHAMADMTAITCILLVTTPVCWRGCGCVDGGNVRADLDVAGREGHVVSRKLLRVARDTGLHLLHYI